MLQNEGVRESSAEEARQNEEGAGMISELREQMQVWKLSACIISVSLLILLGELQL